MFRRLRSFVYGLGLGAGAMYLFDPDRGNRRRAQLRDQAIHRLNKADDAIARGMRDLTNRSSGMIADAKSFISDEEVTDDRLVQRVRSAIGGGGIVSYPRAIDVKAQGGRVTLSGPILAAEVQPLLARVGRIRGVQDVENQLEAHDRSDGVPALSGEPASARASRMRGAWTPGTRLLATSVGGLLTLNGLARGGPMGWMRRLVGLGLMARGLTNQPIADLLGLSREGRGAIGVQKGIQVNAPVGEVFAYWQNFTNFPRFMSNVREVRDLGGGRSHWVVNGPAGTPVEWDAIVTNLVPNQMISWESAPGSQVSQSGRVRFTPVGDRATRLDVQMAYTPPAGLIGHAVASFFGVNPKQSMDEDLVRFKSLIETGKTSTEAGRVTREEVRPSGEERRGGGQPAEDARTRAHRQVSELSEQGEERTPGGKGQAAGGPAGRSGGEDRAQTPAGQPSRSGGRTQNEKRESGMPGGGAGRTDEVGKTGVYPASDPNAPEDAEAQGMASWGQGERGAAGYEDSGSSELSGLGEETDFGSVIPGKGEERPSDEE